MSTEENSKNSRGRVLVIDDDTMVRDVLAQTVQILGYQAHTLGDSRDTLAAVSNFKPDVIILDIVMPDRDGFEVLRELRIAHPNLPVIAMTGGGRMAASQLLRLASMLGAARILPKPFTLEQVDQTLQSALQPVAA